MAGVSASGIAAAAAALAGSSLASSGSGGGGGVCARYDLSDAPSSALLAIFDLCANIRCGPARGMDNVVKLRGRAGSHACRERGVLSRSQTQLPQRDGMEPWRRGQNDREAGVGVGRKLMAIFPFLPHFRAAAAGAGRDTPPHLASHFPSLFPALSRWPPAGGQGRRRARGHGPPLSGRLPRQRVAARRALRRRRRRRP